MKPIFATVTIVGLICAAPGLSAPATNAQQPACLHGQDETATQRDRRQQALRTARQINTYEVNGRGQAGRFQPLTAFSEHRYADGFRRSLRNGRGHLRVFREGHARPLRVRVLLR